MGKTILQSAEVLVESLAGRTPIAEGWQTIRDLEHKGDAVARDMFEMLMTPRPTLIAPDALKALTGYLDDILDAIEAAAARLAIHRIRRAIPAARELGQIVLESAQELRPALELRQNGELFVHTRTLHRLENRGDDVLRDAIGALFSRRASARDIVKWKDICEILEASTDRCEDVANVLETILTQTGREERLVAGRLTMDLSRHDVQVAGAAEALSAKEFALLHLLLRHQGKVVRRERLLGEVWGQDLLRRHPHPRYAYRVAAQEGRTERGRLHRRRPRHRTSAGFRRLTLPFHPLFNWASRTLRLLFPSPGYA